FVENGLNVKIVLFPDDEDPDSYCRKLPQDDFKAYITDKAENFILFKTHLLLEDAKDDPFKRSALIKEIINTISLIPDNIEKAAYIQQCSSILNMKEEILNNHLTKLLREKYFKKNKEGSKETNIPTNDQAPPDDLFLPDDGSSYISNEKAKKQIIEDVFPDEAQERNIISILLNYGDKETTQSTIGENGEKEDINYMVAAYLVGDIVSDNLSFDNKLYQNIFDIYKNYIYEQGNLPELNVFTNNQDSEIQKLATTLLINNYSVSDLWEKKWKIIIPNPESEEKLNQNVKESLLSFKLNKLERKIISNEEKLKEEDDYDNQLILMSEQKILKKLKQIISSELNRIVTR
ncbi:MAG: hypothetical protein VB048_03015, partial [Bacteroidaceae bacterium]|nr:hypothetical protein [Bacteroidaceae bacterium]